MKNLLNQDPEIIRLWIQNNEKQIAQFIRLLLENPKIGELLTEELEDFAKFWDLIPDDEEY